MAYDRGAKLALYARFGVPKVWIVDIAGATIEVFRKPADGAYGLRERLTSGALSPVLTLSVAIDVAALLA